MADLREEHLHLVAVHEAAVHALVLEVVGRVAAVEARGGPRVGLTAVQRAAPQPGPGAAARRARRVVLAGRRARREAHALGPVVFLGGQTGRECQIIWPLDDHTYGGIMIQRLGQKSRGEGHRVVFRSQYREYQIM